MKTNYTKSLFIALFLGVSFVSYSQMIKSIILTDGNSRYCTYTNYLNPCTQPVVNFTADVDYGCSPLCIQFRDLSTISSGTIVQWKWSFGNGVSSFKENPIYCYPDTGQFTVSLTAVSNTGCGGNLVILNMIHVYPHPQASFTYTPSSINILHPMVQFYDKSSGNYPIIYWWWNFGDGDTISIQQNPSHLYRDTGTYCVTLVVMNDHGCVDTAVDCLEVTRATGISNISSSSTKVNIYPVPTKGSFIISGLTQGQTIELYNYMGQRVETQHFASLQNSLQFDISDRVNGIYLIRILNKNGSLVTQKKIVKTH